MQNRAAQFAPFAALTGYENIIQETGRLTDGFIELDEDDKERLNLKVAELMARIEEHPSVTITCFIPDSRKAGGSYSTLSVRLKSIDEIQQALILEDGTVIPFNRIFNIR
jgi:uncharacterized protein (UPF0248 family)